MLSSIHVATTGWLLRSWLESIDFQPLSVEFCEDSFTLGHRPCVFDVCARCIQSENLMWIQA